MKRRPARTRTAHRRQRNPLDLGTAVTPLLWAGGALLAWKMLESSDLGKTLAGLLGGGSGTGGGGRAGGQQPGATQCGWAYIAGNPGNARLSFDVNPWDPPAYEGASVVYSGRLTAIGIGGLYERGIAGMRIDFADADTCQVFASTKTDGDGRYSLSRPLQRDELGGYRVFALFQNDEWSTNLTLGKAATGVWDVVPQPQ